jgi:biopolymer transport protein ExbB
LEAVVMLESAAFGFSSSIRKVVGLFMAVVAATALLGVAPEAARAQEPAATPPPATDTTAAPKSKAEEERDKKRQELANESILAYYFRALGWKYTIMFLMVSFAFVALGILNALALRKQAIMPDALVQNFEAALNEKNFQGAYEMAKEDESFLGAVLAAGMGKLQSGYDAAEEAMNEAGADESMKLEHRLSYIALIGSVSPMLGLLGTVDGMIDSFRVIEQSGTTPEPAALAGGISTALITTIVGLWLAIPAILAFGIYKNVLSRLLYDVGSVAEGLMSRFAPAKK